MRIAALFDIHGNLPALEAVFLIDAETSEEDDPRVHDFSALTGDPTPTLPDIPIETGLSAERTHFAFGVAEQWSLLARVIAVRPRGEQVEITCVAEHPAVHSADGSVDSSTAPI